MEEIMNVGKYLIHHAEKIGQDITSRILKQVDFTMTEEMLEKSIQKNKDFIMFLGESLKVSKEIAAEDLIEWIKKSEDDEAARFTTSVKSFALSRSIYLESISQISIEQGISTVNAVKINNHISYLMDIYMMEKIYAYTAFRDTSMEERQKKINELGAPIVPILHGVAVLPLVGAIDYSRVQHLLNYVLPTIPDLQINHLIIDFSGILTIDEEIAQHIFSIHNVLELLGIHVLLTGIRPNLSIVIVKAGIDFTSFNTFGSVKQALESIEKF